MEKKVPEKNVNMKEDDVFYVYEKRINKCVKEGCEGVVKYGLIMKVNTGHDETINCFECNKCHMKYTPYPNFNRLTDKHLSKIYNDAEVLEWQEHTQKKVELRKNAAAKLAGAKFGERRFTKKPFGNRDENRSYSRKPYRDGENQKPYAGKSSANGEEQKSYTKKPYDKRDDRRNADGGKDQSYHKNSKPYSASKPQTYTVRKGNIIITRTVDSSNSGMQMKRRPSSGQGVKRNPDQK